MRSHRPIWILSCLLALYAQAGWAYQAEPGDRARAERFLELSGGRSVWQEGRSIRLLAVNHVEGIPLPFLFEIWIDFAQPRSMNRILNQDMDRLRAYLGDSGWGMKEGAFARNLWRLAIDDPSLELRTGANGRLEFHNIDGDMTAWFQFGESGHAERFGLPGDDIGLELYAYADFGSVRIPSGGRTPDGVRFESIYVRLNPRALDLPSAPPAAPDAFNPR
jgi:hypothetical protein